MLCIIHTVAGNDSQFRIGFKMDCIRTEINVGIMGDTVTCNSEVVMHSKLINTYRTLAKEGPWAVHLTLGQDWGVGRYSRYQCRI